MSGEISDEKLRIELMSTMGNCESIMLTNKLSDHERCTFLWDRYP